MVRRFAVAVIVATLVGSVSGAAAATCTAAQIGSGHCSVGGGTTGGGVDLWGDVTTDGEPGGSAGDGPDECPVVVNGQCAGTSPPKEGTGPTSVQDIESFRPRTPAQFTEPDGWAIRRVPANFWSTATAHVIGGELLGNPADVRFTPIRYRRYFGDGDRRTTTTPGAPWRDLGQPPWTRTDTSHAYRESGTFRIRLLVWYSAEFRFGAQGWIPLSGEVTAWANDLAVTVIPADSVLVERPCGSDAIGCPSEGN